MTSTQMAICLNPGSSFNCLFLVKHINIFISISFNFTNETILISFLGIEWIFLGNPSLSFPFTDQICNFNWSYFQTLGICLHMQCSKRKSIYNGYILITVHGYNITLLPSLMMFIVSPAASIYTNVPCSQKYTSPYVAAIVCYMLSAI